MPWFLYHVQRTHSPSPFKVQLGQPLLRVDFLVPSPQAKLACHRLHTQSFVHTFTTPLIENPLRAVPSLATQSVSCTPAGRQNCQEPAGRQNHPLNQNLPPNKVPWSGSRAPPSMRSSSRPAVLNCGCASPRHTPLSPKSPPRILVGCGAKSHSSSVVNYLRTGTRQACVLPSLLSPNSQHSAQYTAVPTELHAKIPSRMPPGLTALRIEGKTLMTEDHPLPRTLQIPDYNGGNGFRRGGAYRWLALAFGNHRKQKLRWKI